MSKLHFLLLGGASLALLASCAPSATSAGSVSANTSRERLTLAAGQSASTSVEYSLDDLGVDASQEKQLDVDFTRTDSFGRVQGKEQPVSWFQIVGVNPADWKVQLDGAFLGYEVLKTDNVGATTNVRYRPYVRLVLRVSAPAQAAAGARSVTLSVRNVNGQSGKVPLYLDLRK